MRWVRRYETGGEIVEISRLGCPRGGRRVFISRWHHQFSGSLLGVCRNEKRKEKRRLHREEPSMGNKEERT